MSLTTLLAHDVTILTPGTTANRYGDSTPNWATATSVASKAWVSQRSSVEDLDHREAQVSGWVVFLPEDTAITGRDRVVWGSVTFEVDGPPNRAWTPRGEHHVEANLRVVDG